MATARTEYLYKFSYNSLFSQYIGNRQHQIGSRGTQRKFSRKFQSYDLGHYKIKWLPQNSRFGLDTANPPGYHADTVYHRRMAIGTHEGIGDQFTVPFNDSFGKIFQIYLMANTHPRWHDPKIIKRF